MATGTEGPDVLTNDQSLTSETIDALGGDDTINVRNPHPPGDPTLAGSTVTVDGGSGFDTLNLSAPYINLFPGSAFLNDGTFGPSVAVYLYPAGVLYSGVERLAVTASAYFGRNPFLGFYVPGACRPATRSTSFESSAPAARLKSPSSPPAATTRYIWAMSATARG
ncbi:MAG TPA: hypothetical protein VF759_11815 [Allosphingosinicella sp.]